MSDFDKTYTIWEMASFTDHVGLWDVTDSPLYYYEYSGHPAWFSIIELATGKYHPMYTINAPQSTTGNWVITVLKKEWTSGTLADTITIDLTVNALSEAPWIINHCSTASFAWFGPFGGWESYVFEGKQQTLQGGGKPQTFINQDAEMRFQDRGDIYQGVIHSTKNIPTAHVEHIANMHKSIQAYLWENGNIFTPILIKPQTFKKIKTGEPYVSYQFEFTYAKPDIIQTQ